MTLTLPNTVLCRVKFDVIGDERNGQVVVCNRLIFLGMAHPLHSVDMLVACYAIDFANIVQVAQSCFQVVHGNQDVFLRIKIVAGHFATKQPETILQAMVPSPLTSDLFCLVRWTTTLTMTVLPSLQAHLHHHHHRLLPQSQACIVCVPKLT